MLHETELRKERSIALLKQHRVPYIDHLPPIESSAEAKIKSAEDIARRAVCSLVTIQHAFDLLNNPPAEESREFFEEMLDDWNLSGELTANERQVFSGKADRALLTGITWKYEAIWVLLWALNLVETLDYPDRCCDCEKAVQCVSMHETFEDFLAATKRRTDLEILDQADLIYRLDWACVDARIHSRKPPAELDSDVVMERHMALNWLIGYDNDWDNVSIDT